MAVLGKRRKNTIMEREREIERNQRMSPGNISLSAVQSSSSKSVVDGSDASFSISCQAMCIAFKFSLKFRLLAMFFIERLPTLNLLCFYSVKDGSSIGGFCRTESTSDENQLCKAISPNRTVSSIPHHFSPESNFINFVQW